MKAWVELKRWLLLFRLSIKITKSLRRNYHLLLQSYIALFLALELDLQHIIHLLSTLGAVRSFNHRLP